MAKKSALEQQLDELEKLRAKGVVNDDEYQSRRAAIMSATATQEARKGRGAGKGIMKWGAIGCVGIFGAIGLLVVGLIVIIVAAIGSSADDEPDSGGDVRVALASGSSGTISPEGNGSKKSKVTIEEIVDSVTSTNQFSKPAEGKKWVGFRVTIENVGSKEVGSLDWKLRDSKDVEHDRAFVVGAGESVEVFYDLTPGGKTAGWVYFEIDADATPKWLRADPNPFLADDLYFDAQ